MRGMKQSISGPVLVHINNRYILIRYTDLDIIRREQLVIPHIVLFDSHESSGMISLGIGYCVHLHRFGSFLHIHSALHRYSPVFHNERLRTDFRCPLLATNVVSSNCQISTYFDAASFKYSEEYSVLILNFIPVY